MDLTGLEWSVLRDRKSAVELQKFVCTTERPRTDRGRTLKHPKEWEFEVQALLRNGSRHLKAHGLLLAGRGLSPDHQIDAAAWLEIGAANDVLELFIKACGVCLDQRHRGGVIADEMMQQALMTGSAALEDAGKNRMRVPWNLHVRYSASESYFTRSGFEPSGLPVGHYQ
ncbi:MAG: hypothetical protein L0I80_00095 [Brevibacterium sp.]|uniref:hypothetical protein n=1 Tax=Brevibacterium sp. TaxID=1701 RepID=UPI0026471579|nr:hypothetical protein [Brevibacterium sp.]MDN5807766.1 hypothetical protein [Brevibacterium sp.]MDN5833219.1 hypothetical protein [Brevibacterium sp.]MDN5875841.1 hypothetical protein [Brevibacterium sp.]MDN5908180.1 hypothetical protein [Brevibacterium sp.]MDN6122258.1 hypothetical protein [Brevibacterium sp.]